MVYVHFQFPHPPQLNHDYCYLTRLNQDQEEGCVAILGHDQCYHSVDSIPVSLIIRH